MVGGCEFDAFPVACTSEIADAIDTGDWAGVERLLRGTPSGAPARRQAARKPSHPAPDVAAYFGRPAHLTETEYAAQTEVYVQAFKRPTSI